MTILVPINPALPLYPDNVDIIDQNFENIPNILQFKTNIVVSTDENWDYNCDWTSDQVELQQAIDYVNSQWWWDIFIKKWTYNIAGSILLNWCNNINILWEKWTILKQTSWSSNIWTFIIWQWSSKIKISWLEFDNQLNTWYENMHIMRIREANNIIIENNIFKNALRFATENWNDGIYINVSWTYPAGYGWIENITIQNNKFYNISRQWVSVIRGNNIKISWNYFNVRRSWVDVEPNSANDHIWNIMITNNIVDWVSSLVGVYSVTTSSFVTSAFSWNGAWLELVVNELYTIWKSIIIADNTLNWNNNSAQAIKCVFMENASITWNTINNFWKSWGYCCNFSAITSWIFSWNSIFNFRWVWVFSYLDQNISISNNTLWDWDQAFFFQNAIISNNSILNIWNATTSIFKIEWWDRCKIIWNTIKITNRTILSVFDFARWTTLRPSLFIDNLSVDVTNTWVINKLMVHTTNQWSEFIMKNSKIKCTETSNSEFLYFNYPNQNSISYQSLILQNNNFINCSWRIWGQKLKEFIVTWNTFYNSWDNTTPWYCLHVSEVDSMLVANNRFMDERSTKWTYFIWVFWNFLTSGKQNRLIQWNIFYWITNAINAPANVRLESNLNWDNEIITVSPVIYTWTTAPSTTPIKVWNIYINTTTKDVYVSAWTASSSDWIKTN